MSERNTLANRLVWNRFNRWLKACLEAEVFEAIDIQAEFGTDLSFQEAKAQAMAKFPVGWKVEEPERVREIVFIEPLVEKMLKGEVQVTYRLHPKSGLYYVITNRFVSNGDPRREPRCLLDFYKHEKVVPRNLSNAEARLAGVPSGKELRRLFDRWYRRGTYNEMWRNWFRIISQG